MNLYEITSTQLALIDRLIESEGELDQETELELQINKDELQKKGIQYGYVIKQMDYDIDIIDTEMKRLQRLKQMRSNAQDRLKTSLSTAMRLFDVTELTTPTIKINFRKSESILITDAENIPKEYTRVKKTIEPDKTAIKKAIKEGEIIVGAELVTNQSIQIK